MKYISLLRGINVSGKNKIKMVYLKALYEGLGYTNVVTYIQSGNVIFNSVNQSAIDLQRVIEKEIQRKYGFDVPVEIRSHNEVKNIISNYPFEDIDPIENGSKVLITFLDTNLDTMPSAENIANLGQNVVTPERLHVNGKEIYLYCPNGYGKTKLSNVFIEKKLGVLATTRNWKTVQTLFELSL